VGININAKFYFLLSCTFYAEGGRDKKTQIFQLCFFSEFRNFNVGGPVNQLIKNPPFQTVSPVTVNVIGSPSAHLFPFGPPHKY
jgi:hypothetical protein